MIAPLPLVAAATIAASTTYAQVGLGQSFEQHDMIVTPLEIVEDSRCPTDVMCVQAGRLVVKVRIEANGETREELIALGEMMPLGDRSLFFSFATPAQTGLDLRQGAHFGFSIQQAGA